MSWYPDSARVEDAEGTPTQSHTSPTILESTQKISTTKKMRTDLRSPHCESNRAASLCLARVVRLFSSRHTGGSVQIRQLSSSFRGPGRAPKLTDLGKTFRMRQVWRARTFAICAVLTSCMSIARLRACFAFGRLRPAGNGWGWGLRSGFWRLRFRFELSVSSFQVLGFRFQVSGFGVLVWGFGFGI